ncbi:MAG: NAD-binding protein [Chloroflexi bacterium]|nr:NAD-binding protein [Chloroflexota bacterium]
MTIAYSRPTVVTALRRRFSTIILWLGRPSLVLILLLSTTVIVLATATLLWWEEQTLGGEPAFTNWNNSFWYMLSSVAGIGVGAKAPLTEGGRSLAIIAGVAGSALKGIFTAAVASAFVNRLILEGKGLGDFDVKGHILVCGWNSYAKEMVKVLQQEAYGHGVDVVLLADLPENPLPNTHIKFVRGDPTLDADLQRASADAATSAILLADDTRGGDSASVDARTVLTSLAVESANSKVYTVAEVRDPQNRRHFSRTKTDEMVASSELAGGLLARTALNPGVGHVFSTLMRIDQSAEVFVVPAPPSLAGKSFDELLHSLRRDHGAILIGLQRRDSTMLNPAKTQVVAFGDNLVVVAHGQPPKL